MKGSDLHFKSVTLAAVLNIDWETAGMVGKFGGPGAT